MARLAIFVAGTLLAVHSADLTGGARADTVVQFTLNGQVESPNGPINYYQVQLFDSQAPITVANFLKYVGHRDYDGTIIHRDAQGFVMQGGGFKPQVNAQNQITALAPLATYGAIQNEYSPARSNLRGTIAMAKLGGDPNSATSQWFVNLADNSANLDSQNGGFTVFGQVLGDGMTIVDAIDSLPTYDINSYFDPQGVLGRPFSDVPLFNNGSALVTFHSVAIVPQWIGGAASDSNDWGLAANWSDGASAPGGSGVSIRFGGQTPANSLVDLGAAARTVGQITFVGGAATTVQSAAGKALTLDNGGGIATVTGVGQHGIDAAVRLNSSVAFAPHAADDSIVVHGSLSDGDNGAKGITKYGQGRLILAGENSYSGGTTVILGTLAIAEPGALPAGRGLSIGSGGTVVLADGTSAAGASAAAVPEPRAVALLGVLASGLLTCAWLRRRA